jgi:hypothetical protein
VEEVVGRVAGHPEPPITARERLYSGTVIGTISGGASSSKPNRRAACGLGRVARPPGVERQSTADLDARRRVGLGRGDRQADEADEGGDGRDLDRPEAEPMELEVILAAGGPGFALGTVEDLREELHHPRIGVHRRERLWVLLRTSRW